MSKELIVSQRDYRRSTVDERTIDTRQVFGSWKIVDRVTIETEITRAPAAPAEERTFIHDHGLPFTPAFISMIEEATKGVEDFSLTNIPAFDSDQSYKVSADAKRIYATIVEGRTGTFVYRFRIVILGESIE